MQHRLIASQREGQTQFGDAVALDGRYGVIGPQGENGAAGAVYLFDLDAGIERARFISPQAQELARFGADVAIAGNIAAIGEGFGGRENAGLVHLFNLRTGNALQTLERPDGAWLDGFGESVALHGRSLVVGIAGDDRATDPDMGSAITVTAP